MAECTITCRRCGNQVEVDWDAYQRADNVRCHCGSADLHVEPPAAEITTADLVVGFAGLQSGCPTCGGARVIGGTICGTCGGV